MGCCVPVVSHETFITALYHGKQVTHIIYKTFITALYHGKQVTHIIYDIMIKSPISWR